MRLLVVAALVLAPAIAQADDELAVGAAVGAGGQGGGSYGALELRLDAAWRGVRIGLGGRAVFEDGALRTREWQRAADAIALVRLVEAHAGPVALAAGALAPSTLGHVAEGYRAALDDRARTGARIRLATIEVDASVEIDDVLDPALVGGAVAWQIVPAWGVRAATAVDPSTGRVAIEAGPARRWERDDRRIEVGASLVGERWRSMDASTRVGAVGWASAAIDRSGARWSIAADVRAGNGSNGAAFGPLYRVERDASLDDVRAGIGAGAQLGVASDAGWGALGARWRPGLGGLGTATAGAPMGRHVQASGWIAASREAIAGATEVRFAWATHFYTSLQLARMYTQDEMGLAPAWSATAWFGAVTR